MASTLTASINNGIEKFSVAGISMGVILGVIITISMLKANALQGKFYKTKLAELKDKGYDSDTWLDKEFAAIEESVGLKNKSQPSKPITSADGNNDPSGEIAKAFGTTPRGYWNAVLRFEDSRINGQVGG